MGPIGILRGNFDPPGMWPHGLRGRRFDFGKIERAGSRPDIVMEISSGNLSVVLVEDSHLPPSELASRGAFDADPEFEPFARRNCGRHAPDVHTRGMRPGRE